VRLRALEALVWCACEMQVTNFAVVVVRIDTDEQLGAAIVASGQLLSAEHVVLRGQVIRLASPEEADTWRRTRRQPRAGLTLRAEIEQVPPGAAVPAPAESE
jgi:hypothetical protein